MNGGLSNMVAAVFLLVHSSLPLAAQVNSWWIFKATTITPSKGMNTPFNGILIHEESLTAEFS